MRLLDSDGKPFKPEPTLSAWPMFVHEFEKMLENNLAFQQLQRVAELRKSCGVEGPKTTVMIRRPPRYGDSNA